MGSGGRSRSASPLRVGGQCPALPPPQAPPLARAPAEPVPLGNELQTGGTPLAGSGGAVSGWPLRLPGGGLHGWQLVWVCLCRLSPSVQASCGPKIGLMPAHARSRGAAGIPSPVLAWHVPAPWKGGFGCSGSATSGWVPWSTRLDRVECSPGSLPPMKVVGAEDGR